MRRLCGRVGIALRNLGAVERFIILDRADVADVDIVAQHTVAVPGGITEMRLRIAKTIAGKVGGKIFEAGDLIRLILVFAQPAEKNYGMTSGRRGAVADKIAGPRIFKICNRGAQAVASNGPGFGIAFAFDVPELQRIEEIVESHAVEIIGVEAVRMLRSFIARHKHFEGETQQ